MRYKITNKIYNKVCDLAKSNYFLDNIVISLLGYDVLTKNPIYSYLYEAQMKKVMERFRDKPLKVIIENTNICNSDCIFCVHSKMSRKIGFMDFSLYKNIIDECASIRVKEVAVYRLGEPLLDREFSEKVTYAKKRGIEIVSTNTNASLLNEENTIKILHSGLDVLYISLDATSKEVYERIRRGLNYDIVIENINRFIKLRNAKGKKLTIILNYCVTEENKYQIKDFINKWKNRVEQIWISDTHDWSGVVGKKRDPLRRTDPCRLLWTEMVISWDGKVPLCCIDYDDSILIGDVKKESINEIWNGEILKTFRECHINKQFGRISLCNNCTCNFFWWVA